MDQQRGTRGAVIIELAANGFVVTLPPKMTNPYSGLSDQMRPIMHGENEIEELQRQGEAETPAPETGYAMDTIGNMYVFHNWEGVLAFLADQLDPVPVNDRR